MERVSPSRTYDDSMFLLGILISAFIDYVIPKDVKSPWSQK